MQVGLVPTYIIILSIRWPVPIVIIQFQSRLNPLTLDQGKTTKIRQYLAHLL